MKRNWKLGLFALLLVTTGIAGGMGCGNDCEDGQVEVCPDFMTVDKNGEFFDDCICTDPECDSDSDCGDGFNCDNNFCVAN